MESKAALVAASPVTDVDGTWCRHAAARYQDAALSGRRSYGRWGKRSGIRVLYLGRPTDSVVVEAYRHLVDPVEDQSILDTLEPRVLITCTVQVSNVLDLRSAGSRLQVDLSLSDLHSDTNDADAYERCQEVAEVAHQLGRHGIITPAATGLGDTLALFTNILPADERPTQTGEPEIWEHLPADPRRQQRASLRLVHGTESE